MDWSNYSARDALSLPGLLSLSRVGFAAVFPLLVESPRWALATIAMAALSDALDGYVARKRGLTTPTGAALDPLTDKIFATSVMVSLLAHGRLSLGSALLLSSRELLELPLLLWLLSMPHARAARAADLKANWLGKLTTGLQFGALVSLLLQLSHVTAWLVATAVAGALAAARYWASFVRAVTRHGKSEPPAAVGPSEAGVRS